MQVEEPRGLMGGVGEGGARIGGRGPRPRPRGGGRGARQALGFAPAGSLIARQQIVHPNGFLISQLRAKLSNDLASDLHLRPQASEGDLGRRLR